MDQNRFRIMDHEHPHAGESGSLEIGPKGGIAIREILGKEKIKMFLDYCPHNVKACFVSREQISHIGEIDNGS